ncbi:MAG TPA: AMP-binding protein [Streptosporangiaceae bacterium]|jgi:fatty-acyl-CoA synthase
MTADHLTKMLDDLAAAHAERVAAVEPNPGPGAAARSLTYAGLRDASVAVAARLRAAGVRRGDVVGVWLPNWLESLTWQFGAATLGAGVLGVNTRYHVHELTHLLTQARPVCVALPRAFLGLDFTGRLRDAVAEARKTVPDLRPPAVVPVDGPVPAGPAGEGFDVGGGVWHETADAAPGGPAGRGADMACYFTTSGSTGVPKLAGHPQSAVVRHAVRGAAALGIAPGDAMLCVLPLAGTFGFNAAFAALAAGATCVLEPVFDPDRTLEDMAAYGVTHTVGGDDLMGRLLDTWRERPRALGAWRRGGIAEFNGRVPEIAAWAEAEFGAVVSGVYGSSEVFALTSVWPFDLPAEQRAAGGGHVVDPGIEVRAADLVTGEVCTPGVTGELQFRGYNVLPGYLGNPSATAAAFTDDGWYRSGDLGTTGEPGVFTYACRAGDALRVRGFLVEPAEIERFLATHEAVEMAKVVGADDASGTPVAVAFVTLRDGTRTDEHELRAYCTAQLAPFKVPARVVIVPEFPTTTGTNGTKIRAAELSRQAADLFPPEETP